MRKIIAFVLIGAMLLSLGWVIKPAPVYSDSAPTTNQQDIAYFAIWKHSNGTWQKGEKPESTVSAMFTVNVATDDSQYPTNFNIEFLDSRRFMEADFDKYRDYNKYSVRTATVDNFQYEKGGKLTYNITTQLVSRAESGEGQNVRQEWQGENVEGYKYYVPVMITWEYSKPDLALYFEASGYDNTTQKATVVLNSEVYGVEKADRVQLKLTGAIEEVETISIEDRVTNTFTVDVPQTEHEQQIQFTAVLNEDKTFEEQDFSNNTVSSSITIPALTTVSKCLGSGTSETVLAVVGGNKVRRCSGTGENWRCHWVCTPSKTVEKDLNQSGSVSYSDIKIIGDWSLFKEVQNFAKSKSIPYANDESGSKIKADDALNSVGVDYLYRGIRSGRGIKIIGNVTIAGSTMATSQGSAKGMAESFRNSVIDSLEVEGIEVLNNHQSKVQGADKSGTGQESVSVSSVSIGKVTECGGSEKTIFTVKYNYTFPIVIDKPDDKNIQIIQNAQKTYTAYDVEKAQNKFYTHINTMNGLYGLKFRSAPNFGMLKLPTVANKTYCESNSESFAVYGTMFEETGGISAPNLNGTDIDWFND